MSIMSISWVIKQHSYLYEYSKCSSYNYESLYYNAKEIKPSRLNTKNSSQIWSWSNQVKFQDLSADFLKETALLETAL